MRTVYSIAFFVIVYLELALSSQSLIAISSTHISKLRLADSTTTLQDSTQILLADSLSSTIQHHSIANNTIQYSGLADTTIDYLTGRFLPSKHPMFVPIAKKYRKGATMWLRIETYKAFAAMADSAKKDGITLVILSATRNFDDQKEIWEKKWKTLFKKFKPKHQKTISISDTLNSDSADVQNGLIVALEILRYSSMPSTSRHHWGTDIDINTMSNSVLSTGKQKNVYTWLRKNAHLFGFCQPYTQASTRSGYNEERWHWSYTPIAARLTRLMQSSVRYCDIYGFIGSYIAEHVSVLSDYVVGISPCCKHDVPTDPENSLCE